MASQNQNFTFSDEFSSQFFASGSGEHTAAGQYPLLRRDLFELEHLLLGDLAAILPFQAHALYFPQKDEVRQPIWIPEEEKLLLPLHRTIAGDRILLGVLMLRQPDLAVLETLLPYLPRILALCLDKLAIYKWGKHDALTGLLTKDAVLEMLGCEMGKIKQSVYFGNTGPVSPKSDLPGSDLPGQSPSNFQGTLSLTVIRFSGLQEITRKHGYSLSEKTLAALGQALLDVLPAQYVAARSGDSEFAVLAPGLVGSRLADQLKTWLTALETVSPSANPLASLLAGSKPSISTAVGYVQFPQDWDPAQDGHEHHIPRSQAEYFFNKARLTAVRAQVQQPGKVLGYNSILCSGGLVEMLLPLSRLRTNLGRNIGAREGLRFLVRGRLNDATASMSSVKGEIVLVDVWEDYSLAEIVLLAGADRQLEEGDTLELASENIYSEPEGGLAEPVNGLYRYNDFMVALALERKKCAKFSLALVLVQPSVDWELAPESDEDINRQELVIHAAAEIIHAFSANIAAAQAHSANFLLGRYSRNSLVLFHPDLEAGAAKESYLKLTELLQAGLTGEEGCKIALGIACLPWLTYRPADALECSRKALDYALLLPQPHVGIFDTLAINISADRHYSQGDLFGAIEEYRLALLADEQNILAWNSLGVCQAALGKHAEARRTFEQAIRRNPRDLATQYNLGNACLNAGDLPEARKRFDTCLELSPNYSFAYIKLGELAEMSGQNAEARKYFDLALAAEPGNPTPYRCLARLDLADNQPEKAREKVHQALQRDPHDSLSLLMLCRLYLEGGEDPGLAETLARQSLSLHPRRKSAWLELARTLEAQNRPDLAREALLSASAL